MLVKNKNITPKSTSGIQLTLPQSMKSKSLSKAAENLPMVEPKKVETPAADLTDNYVRGGIQKTQKERTEENHQKYFETAPEMQILNKLTFAGVC